jgi:hypothetical protein
MHYDDVAFALWLIIAGLAVLAASYAVELYFERRNRR